MQLFISYAHANKEKVLELLQGLDAHEVWFDERLNIGDEWWPKIEKQIATCHCFVFILSSESLKSSFCMKELELAKRLKKPIAPIKIGDIEIPDIVSNYQIFDITEDSSENVKIKLLNGLFEIERDIFNPLRPRSGTGQSLEKLNIAELFLITTNHRKKADFEAILNTKLQFSPVEIDDIQHLDVGEVALQKVKQAYLMLQKPVFVEQSGLAIHAWGGLPGGMTTTFIHPLGINNVCKMMKVFENHAADALSVVAYTDGTVIRKFIGRLEGTIATKPRFGEGGMSWSSIFIPNGFTETLSEMHKEKSLSISMRRRAIVQFMRFLQENYDIV